MAAAARRGGGPFRLALAVATITVACWPTSGHAGMSLTLQPPVVTSAPGGGPGSFEVWITNTGDGSLDLAGFSIELSLEQVDTVVEFTDVTKGPFSIPSGYVFSTPGPPPFTFDIFPNRIFIASDTEDDPSGSRTIAAGATYGLALVSFDPGAVSGTALVKFIRDGTTLSDPDFNSIDDFTTMGGEIVVAPLAAVPEPSTLLMAVIGLGLPLLNHLRRGRSGRGTGT